MNRKVPFRQDDKTPLRDAIVWQQIAEGQVDLAFVVVADHVDIERHLPLLSAAERRFVSSFKDVEEQRHFVLRRAFQRLFVATLLNWEGALADLPLVHARDTRARCEAAPDLRLSFSTSRNVYCACASTCCEVGIDVEARRSVANPAALAHRFFTESEAELVTSASAEKQGPLFLGMWTAKEAGLKALGLGIVSGLNRFTLKLHRGSLILSQHKDWILTYPLDTEVGLIAVVHRPVN